MTQYVNVKVKISEWQKEKLQHAFKANCPTISIRLDHEDLNIFKDLNYKVTS